MNMKFGQQKVIGHVYCFPWFLIQEQGVYCIYNHKGVVMYIGLSMNLQRSVEKLGGLWVE